MTVPPRPEAPATILLVAGASDVLDAIGAILRAAGHVVVKATTGSAALERAREGLDLIVLDVDLPDVDGIEVCRRIKGDPILATIPVLHASGAPRTVPDRVRGLDAGADGCLVGSVEADEVLATVHALLRRRQTQVGLVEAQKMEAVGRLAGGVAHGFNNLLSVVMGHSELLLTALEADDPLRDSAEEIRSASQRAADLARQLLALGRRQLLQPRVLDVNAMVAGVAARLRGLIPGSIEIATRLAPDVGRVEADPGQLEQVIMNLALNARDAMPGGGRLVLETADVLLREVPREGQPGTRIGRAVSVVVRDTGRGIDASIRPHLFEPFFTTKGPGLGTGLGLSTVYGIVAQHQGHVEVESQPGRGSTFTVYLPRVDGPIPADGAGPRSSGAWRGTETVLVVEDDPGVRGLVRTMLARSGYAVLVADSGAEALEVARRYDQPIDVLLTDVVMPHMSGRELAERLVATRPGLRVVYVSGYAGDVIARDHVREPGTTFLGKPFTEEGLGRAIRDVLGGAPRSAREPAVDVPGRVQPVGEAPAATTPLVVVQRGRSRLYEMLRAELETQSRARVVWDRRVEERRRAWGGITTDRRRSERRGAIPNVWRSVGFVLVS